MAVVWVLLASSAPAGPARMPSSSSAAGRTLAWYSAGQHLDSPRVGQGRFFTGTGERPYDLVNGRWKVKDPGQDGDHNM